VDDPSVRVPDGIEPISAYRAWVFSIEHGQAELFPLGGWSADWRAAASGWATATCLRAIHEAPSEGCSCGFYSLKDLHEAITLGSPIHATFQSGGMGLVLGRVLLSGKVIEHESGYRAERAQVAELIPFCGTERSVMVLVNRLGVGMAAAVEPSLPLDISNPQPRSLPPPPSRAIPAPSDDALGRTIVGVLATLLLVAGSVLLVSGTWQPPVALFLISIVTIGRSSESMGETYREWRDTRARSGPLRLVPPPI
jgi:hypothetical protein